MMMLNDSIVRLRSAIEHTVLKPDTTHADVERCCREAAEQAFAAVCVPPYFVPQAVDLLSENAVEVATVIGFPYGYHQVMAKYEEAEESLRNGANHLDMVLHIAAIKNGDWDTVSNEMDMMARLCHSEGAVLKCIAETGLLNEIELELVCRLANDVGIDYLKTSTGVQVPGARTDVVKAMRGWLQPEIRIKASGGIKTGADALSLLDAGADRIGTSNGLLLISA